MKEVKKITPRETVLQLGSLKSRRHRSKENKIDLTRQRSKESKVDITRKDFDAHNSSYNKSPRLKEERNVFDFGVRKEATGSTTGTSSTRDAYSSTREVFDFTSSSRLEYLSSTSRELIKSSSEFLSSKNGSREVLTDDPPAAEQDGTGQQAAPVVASKLTDSGHGSRKDSGSRIGLRFDLDDKEGGYDSSRGGGDGLRPATLLLLRLMPLFPLV